MVLNVRHEPGVHEIASVSERAYHLTPEQIQFFDDNGYLVLRNWIPSDMLHSLQAAAEGWIEQGWQRDTVYAEDAQTRDDFAFALRDEGKKVMFRVNYLHNKGNTASLELLGSPQVLGVAESMCGHNFVPTYESMVFKQEGDGEAISWHQDAVHPRRYRIFNYDLYLDRSTVDTGALRVVPGSQVDRHDVCQVRDEHGWNPPGVIAVEMEPGDVLLHDVMVLHGSPRTEGTHLRRTIYYEFRAAEEIVEEGPWDRAWIDQRLRLLPIALRDHARAYPQSEQFDWKIDAEFAPETSQDDEAELRIAHLVHMSGEWCSAGSVTA